MTLRSGPDKERGLVAIWTVVLIAACFAVIGLVLDGGAVLRARSEAYGLAGAAAREASQELRQDEVVNGRPILDRNAARRAAYDHLADGGVTGTVLVTSTSVTVTVNRPVRLQILAGSTMTVTASAVAQPHKGQG